MWKKCVVFCYGAKEITYIVESGRLVIRQSAIHIQFCQRVNARLCDHVIAARSQQVFPNSRRCTPPPPPLPRRTAPLIFAGRKVNSVGTHSVGTVRAASHYNLSCMCIPRGSGFTSYAMDGCRLA